MEPLTRIQGQIASLRDLRDLFRALRALAASHVQEAQNALSGIRRYVEVVEDAIVETASLPSEARPDYGALPPDGRSVQVVVCSEHGFVGGFNERLLDYASATRGDGQNLIVVGHRGATLAAELGIEVSADLAMATHVGGVLRIARLIAEALNTATTADLVFGSYRRGGNYEPVTSRVLPLAPSLLAGVEQRSPPLHHLPPNILMAQLANEYLFAQTTRAVMESFASENGASLHVMENADRNIDDRLDLLRHSEHSLRQDGITSELLDVVTGSEAILGDGRR